MTECSTWTYGEDLRNDLLTPGELLQQACAQSALDNDQSCTANGSYALAKPDWLLVHLDSAVCLQRNSPAFASVNTAFQRYRAFV